MYLLAAICLSNFLTIHAAEESLKRKRFQEKCKAKQADVMKSVEFQKCFADATKMYDGTYYTPKDECVVQEYVICGATNSKAKQFLEGLDEQEKEWATSNRKEVKEFCKTSMKTMRNCRADCEKIYPSWETNMNLKPGRKPEQDGVKTEDFKQQLKMRILEMKAKEDKALKKQVREQLEKNEKNIREIMEQRSCVKSLLHTRAYLHAEFHSENKFDSVQSGQKMLAYCQTGYEAMGPGIVMYKCSNGIWIPDTFENEINCSKTFNNENNIAQDPLIIVNNAASYAVSITVWLIIAALN